MPVYARHAKPVGRAAPPALLRRSRRGPASRPARWALGTALSLAICAGLMISGAPGFVTASQQVGRTKAPADTAAPYNAYADSGATPSTVPVVAKAAPKAGKPSASDGSNASGGSAASELASDGIPQTALSAYEDAANREFAINPSCGLTWPLLAGIGRVESNHGRFAGAVLHTDGVSTPKIIGIPLDGNGTALIYDTDHGALDGDTVYDRAVGPMQFIPSTWANWGVDMNGDGVADPFNIFDAAAAAADYLCAAGKDLTTVAGQTRAVRAYNDSDDYIRLVLKLEGIYASGVDGMSVPVLSDTSPAPSGTVNLPPVDPGTPLTPGSSTSQPPVTAPSAVDVGTPAPESPVPSSSPVNVGTPQPVPSSSQASVDVGPPAPPSSSAAPINMGTPGG